MSFIPETPPVSSPDLAEYLARLEQRIAQAFEQKDDVGVTEAEPEKVFVGMIRYADGSGWDPGSGQGMYAYDDTGWIKVGAAVWGLIAGSLSDQVDLQASLDGKSDIGHTHVKADITNFSDADYATATQGTKADTAYSWGDHALVGYLTAETNDLSSVVTWAVVPNAYISEASVTQHEAALTITESQISDLGSYLPLAGGTLTGNLLIDQGTTGQTSQLSFADTDTTLTTYDLSHIRRNTDSIQIGFQKSSDGSSANALVIDGDDTDGLDLVTFRGAPIRFRYHGGNNEFHIYNGYVQAENALVLNPLSSAPGSPTTGMLAYADGTSWDPGSGAGVYVYKGAGWTFIA